MHIPDINKKIILLGGGGHALSLIESFPDFFAGYLAESPNNEIVGIPFLGDDNMVESLVEKEFLFHHAFIFNGTPDMNRRKKTIDFYKRLGVKFASLVSRDASVSPNSVVGEGTAVMRGAILNKVTTGENVVINTGAIIDHDTVIGNNTFIGPGVVCGGSVNIGENCFIGLGARLRNNISIVADVVIAMGATVTKSIEKPGIYYGVV